MSETPTDSASGSSKSKAISSLAKRTSDVTRQGTQKLKFVPVLPTRRKKEEVKTEPTPDNLPTTSRDRGRGRGRGGDGRGGGRGSAPRPPVEMTASGPFAMGPTLAGNNARRSIPKSTPIPVPSRGTHSDLGAGLSRTPVPSIKVEEGKGKGKAEDVDEEVYSDPDEGIEIVDMENVRQMDWMAPESLRKERTRKKKVKKEDPDSAMGEQEVGEVNLANAIDLSESEEEEELEDIIEDFGQQADLNDDPTLRQDRLYFFQFPSPFPTFESKSTNKKVTFASDVKPESNAGPSQASSESAEPKETTSPIVDGVIGQLEIYRSGAVKMRLANGILLDVSAATQPSFLQHAVSLDMEGQRLAVLGEVNKRFTVAPDVDSLLAAMAAADQLQNQRVGIEGEENLIKMDVT